jgi:hypothetical protein
MSIPITRRRVLESATAVIALPAFESLGFRKFAAASAAATPPKRLIFLGFGWGVTEESWYPDIKTPGTDYTLSPGLTPLARHKADFSVVQNMWHKYSVEGHEGSTMWLTGANRFAQPGQTFHNSISADQVAATQFGMQTRFASLELDANPSATKDVVALSGHGPGLSLAWDSRGKPVAGLKGPVEAFHRLFSQDKTPIEQQKAMLAEQRSVLDTVLESGRDLKRRLGQRDTAKLEEYFDGIRDIESRLSKDEQWIGVAKPSTTLREPGPTLEGREEIKLMYDLLVAALQTDSTRVITYRQPVGTLLTSLGIKVFPHDMSHYHTTRAEKLDCSQKRDLAQSELLAGLLDRLKATKEADGSRLFDNVTLAYGSNIRTGHELSNCPTILAGAGAGLKLGHNIVMPKNTPLCNAWLTILKRSGVDVEKHGDSTGIAEELLA